MKKSTTTKKASTASPRTRKCPVAAQISPPQECAAPTKSAPADTTVGASNCSPASKKHGIETAPAMRKAYRAELRSLRTRKRKLTKATIKALAAIERTFFKEEKALDTRIAILEGRLGL